MIDPELEEFLLDNGYYNLKEIEGHGVCGLRRFMFTVGLCKDLTKDDFGGRWCYAHADILDSIVAIETWKGEGDPPGKWIKFKGKTEYSNPVYHENIN